MSVSIHRHHNGSMSGQSGRSSGRYSPAPSISAAPDLPQPRENSHGGDDDDTIDSEREVAMKRIDKQYLCRGLVFLNALTVAAAGIFVLVLGAFALSGGPSSWLPAAFGSRQADVVSIGSLCTGIVVTLISLAGVFGACRRKKPFLYLFGLLVALVLAVAAGCTSILRTTEWVLGEWAAEQYRLAGLDSESLETLHAVYTQIGALYGFCLPNATGVRQVITALDQLQPPPSDAFACREPILEGFASWANEYCLAATLFNQADSADRLSQIAGCRADIAAFAANDSFSAVVSPDAGDTAWLFCTCGRPLGEVLVANWLTPTWSVGLALCLYLALLIVLLCGACRGASKAKKRKKKNEFQMQVLSTAQKEAGIAQASSCGDIHLSHREA